MLGEIIEGTLGVFFGLIEIEFKRKMKEKEELKI
ncbi:MAG: hypothetical protein ACI840_001545 [Ulvibacter sp.]|jgi:hypothetical protein